MNIKSKSLCKIDQNFTVSSFDGFCVSKSSSDRVNTTIVYNNYWKVHVNFDRQKQKRGSHHNT